MRATTAFVVNARAKCHPHSLLALMIALFGEQQLDPSTFIVSQSSAFCLLLFHVRILCLSCRMCSITFECELMGVSIGSTCSMRALLSVAFLVLALAPPTLLQRCSKPGDMADGAQDYLCHRCRGVAGGLQHSYYVPHSWLLHGPLYAVYGLTVMAICPGCEPYAGEYFDSWCKRRDPSWRPNTTPDNFDAAPIAADNDNCRP